jgi:WXG100 family type VII secretion target
MAVSDNATVDTSVMRSGAKVIDDHAGQVTDKENKVRDVFDTLMTTWTGDAAVIFDNAMTDFYTKADDIVGQLHRLATDVRTAATRYDQHDETVTAIVKSAPGLPGF